MRHTVRLWIESMVGKPYEWGKTDCNWLTVNYLTLQNGILLPEKYEKLRDSYSTEEEADEIAKDIDYNDLLGVYNYQLIDDEPKAGDVLIWNVRNRHYKLMMPVVYGSTVLCLGEEVIELKSLNILKKDFHVYRRTL